MKLAEDDNPSTYIINGYDNENIIINKKSYNQSLILMPNALNSTWPISSIEQLSDSLLQPLLINNPELILLAFTHNAQLPPTSAIACLTKLNLGYEIMSIPAACKTFNLLSSEGRHVSAGFIL